ncbi:hypothetical protein, partial [Enterobacter asburiae]|uniref:hypothetical protein n=1 Tax=Enterobacter asburiae TaxID=61645 RepID=UPI001F155995
GSVIAGNNVTLKGGSITNGGSTLLAKNSLTLDSQNSISNLSNGLMKAGGDLNLSAIGDINNISSTISGKTVALESLDGSINNLTQVEQIDINAGGKYGNIGLKDTLHRHRGEPGLRRRYAAERVGRYCRQRESDQRRIQLQPGENQPFLRHVSGQ